MTTEEQGAARVGYGGPQHLETADVCDSTRGLRRLREVIRSNVLDRLGELAASPRLPYG